MTTLINVARYHLVDRIRYLALPWIGTMAWFVVDLVIVASIPRHGNGGGYTFGVLALFGMFLVVGIQSVMRSLPLGLALGVGRRSYYLGTVGLAVVLAAADGLLLSGVDTVENATGGWGMRVHFFQVPYLMDGPWYRTWLTAFVALTLLFVYGMWFGLAYRRWGQMGLLTFIVGQAVVVMLGVLVVTWSHAWPGVGAFFTTLTALGLTGVLAIITVVAVTGGLVTMRRVTV